MRSLEPVKLCPEVMSMVSSFFKMAVRSLHRNKSYTIINVLGLAVGVASCLLMFLVIRYELSYDTFLSKRDRIARVVSVFEKPGGVVYSPGVPFPVADALRSGGPHLERVADLYAVEQTQISVPDERGQRVEKKFKERRGVFYAEPEIFDILDFQWLAGDPGSALALPQNAVLTRETAQRYFGDWKTAMGRTVLFKNRDAFIVAGIVEDYPANSDFPFKVLLSEGSIRAGQVKMFEDWVSVSGTHHCYVLLRPGATTNELDAFLASLVTANKPPEYRTDRLASQRLADMHFDDRYETFSGRTFSRELIAAVALIALFLLITACVNYINLSTAQAVNRSREVAVRKVLGGGRTQLMAQFLAETAVITFLAVLAGIAIAEVALPFLSRLLDVPLHLNPFGDPGVLVALAAIAVAVTVLSGSYPALMLSGFDPSAALRAKTATGLVGGITLRRTLVVLQFTIAQMLIFGMLVVVSQMDFFRNKSLGFDEASIVTVPMPNDSLSLSKIDVLKTRLLQQSGISSVSFSVYSASDNIQWVSDFVFDRSATKTDFNADLKWADADFLKTCGIQIVAGRPYQQSDTVREVVVNEALVRRLGLRSPRDILGKEVRFWDGRISASVVGVVKDFQQSSLRQPLAPVMLGCWKETYRLANIKLQPGPPAPMLAAIERLWNETYPDYVYEYQFLDEKIDQFYRLENRLTLMFKAFAGIAIFISCLGLYGLIAFLTIQRTKEVGIRKVLGASVGNIILLLSREFVILVGIAFAVAAPIAYYVMSGWLERYAFRIQIGIGLFLFTILGTVIIAWATVGFQAIRAATANPVDALRYE
jgi:putative ABC transport system permease protein